MNLGVETGGERGSGVFLPVFQHSLMNLGVETVAVLPIVGTIIPRFSIL